MRCEKRAIYRRIILVHRAIKLSFIQIKYNIWLVYGHWKEHEHIFVSKISVNCVAKKIRRNLKNLHCQCLRIWKLSADFTLIQCMKIVSIFLGSRYVWDDFLGSKLVSFNQTLAPYEISKVNFWWQKTKFLSVCQKRFNKIWK